MLVNDVFRRTPYITTGSDIFCLIVIYAFLIMKSLHGSSFVIYLENDYNNNNKKKFSCLKFKPTRRISETTKFE